jgi:hypothetical protein
MKRSEKIMGLLVSTFLLAVAVQVVRAAAQTEASSPSSNSRDQKMLAVYIVRLINTAEVVDCRTEGGKIDEEKKFLPWDELLNAPCFQQAHSRVFVVGGHPVFSPGPEIVPGLELRLVVSADGKHYNLWIGQKAETCGFAFYSDERGLIYEGKPIGCDENPSPSH